MANEIRRPAGVNPGVLKSGPEILEAEARAIGRRATHKILAAFGDTEWNAQTTFELISEVIEAEVRSTWGTPAEGDVVVRLRYAEGVQALAAINEAIIGNPTETESQILGDAKRKFLLAIGLG